jgi:hypothetical protein
MALMTPEKVLTKVRKNVQPRDTNVLDLLPRKITKEGIVFDQHIREGRFQRSFALLTAISGLFTGLEVLYEHYKGSYNQRIMYTPLIMCLALFVTGLSAAFSRWAARVALPIVSLLTFLDGCIGFFFHIRGIQRKPGGWRIPVFNIVMGPPISAPLLFASVGILGLIASLLRRENASEHVLFSGISQSRPAWLNWLPRTITKEGLTFEQDIREGRFQRFLAFLTAITAFFSGIEALYSHYQNNFSYRIQWTPIITTPILMTAGFGAIWSRTLARTFLPLASALAVINGCVGFFFHARGVRRRPGGLKKPLYNIMYGPPILAPLMFAASGCIGLLASLLRRAR